MKNPTATHTEGPWTAYPPMRATDTSEYWEIEDPAGHTATVYGDDEEAAANAKLIAAAPELLDALDKVAKVSAPLTMEDAVFYLDTLRTIARAAIAKATA